VKAIQHIGSVPRYLISRVIGPFYRPIFWSLLSNLQYREVPEPLLPNENWAKIKVRYGGVCASDMSTILLHGSPALSAFLSFPFTMGHENVGTIAQLGSQVKGFREGARVVVDPTVGCQVRGFTHLCPACQRGNTGLCERLTEGEIAPGLLTGFCRDTGGSWSPCLVAHASQLFKVPATVNDENGVLVEPFSVALHAVLRNYPQDEETVLVIGAGVIGICIVAALRSLGSKARVVVLAKHPFQGEVVKRYGADQVIRLTRGYSQELAQALGATPRQPLLGKPIVVGGADIVYECVGSGTSLDDGLRFTRSGGKMVLVGCAAIPKGVDWTPVWLNEIEIKGSWIYGTELHQGKRIHTFQLALDLMAEGKVELAPLVTHKFQLEDYRRALTAVANKRKSEVVKAVFAFE
jgi:threonine dehydrogenase-like Zn-dependent dehydrogenase